MFRQSSPLTEPEERIVTAALDVGYTVHRVLGPGFREVIYKRAYCLELESRGIQFECEKRIQVRYKEWSIPGQKIDLIVANVVLVEPKSVPRLRKIHRLQVLSYLKSTGLRVGLLMNFNAVMFKGNVQRIVN